MRKKEIKEKFEKFEQDIKSLTKSQEDLYEITRFILDAMKKYTDEPIFRIMPTDNGYKSIFSKEYALQYAYENKVKEIRTYKNIYPAELFAYCNTPFILKNNNNKYFLIDMANKTITDIPAQLLFSKGASVTIKEQMFKICPSSNDIAFWRPDND